MMVKHNMLFYHYMLYNPTHHILFIPSVFHTIRNIPTHYDLNLLKIIYWRYINNTIYVVIIFINHFYSIQYIIIIIFMNEDFLPN